MYPFYMTDEYFSDRLLGLGSFLSDLTPKTFGFCNFESATYSFDFDHPFTLSPLLLTVW
jgi:hypothetical protein